MSKLRCFTAYWNHSRGELQFDYAYQFQWDCIKKNDSLAKQDRVLVLDALQDAIVELTELYDKTLDLSHEDAQAHYVIALSKAIKE
jgi:hypothetical protein